MNFMARPSARFMSIHMMHYSRYATSHLDPEFPSDSFLFEIPFTNGLHNLILLYF
jgi:hypothetical protein